jgi:hypothetical protein
MVATLSVSRAEHQLLTIERKRQTVQQVDREVEKRAAPQAENGWDTIATDLPQMMALMRKIERGEHLTADEQRWVEGL